MGEIINTMDAERIRMLRTAARCCREDGDDALAIELLSWADSIEETAEELIRPFTLSAGEEKVVANALDKRGAAEACKVLRAISGRSLRACFRYIRAPDRSWVRHEAISR